MALSALAARSKAYGRMGAVRIGETASKLIPGRTLPRLRVTSIGPGHGARRRDAPDTEDQPSRRSFSPIWPNGGRGSL